MIRSTMRRSRPGRKSRAARFDVPPAAPAATAGAGAQFAARRESATRPVFILTQTGEDVSTGTRALQG